jgi:hypothetical protein
MISKLPAATHITPKTASTDPKVSFKMIMGRTSPALSALGGGGARRRWIVTRIPRCESHTRAMSYFSVADVQVTGTAVQYLFYALTVPIVLLVFLIYRTSPRSPAYNLSRFETMLAPWLWTRRKRLSTMIFAAITGVGAILCGIANFLPVVTFTSQPLFPGDPFAGAMEHDPTARVMGLILGIIIALFALRRAAGGEGITVPISLLLASVLALVAVLALTDYLGNDGLAPDRFTPAVTAGPGLTVLLIGAAVAWVGCAADLITGIRESMRVPLESTRPVIQP